MDYSFPATGHNESQQAAFVLGLQADRQVFENIEIQNPISHQLIGEQVQYQPVSFRFLRDSKDVPEGLVMKAARRIICAQLK
jgi:hypothetical protein